MQDSKMRCSINAVMAKNIVLMSNQQRGREAGLQGGKFQLRLQLQLLLLQHALAAVLRLLLRLLLRHLAWWAPGAWKQQHLLQQQQLLRSRHQLLLAIAAELQLLQRLLQRLLLRLLHLARAQGALQRKQEQPCRQRQQATANPTPAQQILQCPLCSPPSASCLVFYAISQLPQLPRG